MDFLALLILSLATWRISIMLVREAGPFSVFRRLRELSGITHDADGAVLTVPADRFFAGLFSCVWCASVWIGAGWTIFWFFLPRFAILAGTVFFLSAVAIVVDRFLLGQNTP